MLWPHIEAEYQQELEGIAKGVQSKGVKLDVWDIVALNGSIELPQYYVPWLNKREHAAERSAHSPQGRCSAFIATGSYTKDGKIVIAHNNWTSYAEGERWTVMFDIQPEHGHRMLMDGAPGVITSQDDFGVNDAGLMITETTITQFVGWNPDGKPEFVRSRKAMQYASSIDEYVALIKEGNNGGYANDWLIGDRKTGEIAYLELGLKNTPLWRIERRILCQHELRARSGADQKRDRRIRAERSLLLAECPASHRGEADGRDKGRIDVQMAEQFLADHDDSLYGQGGSRRSIALRARGHRRNRAFPQWTGGRIFPAASVTGKVTDSDLAGKMSLIAHAGHPCGEDFLAAPFLAAHPEYGYLKPYSRI